MKNPSPCPRALSALALCSLALGACGGGATTTVTVTEPAAEAPAARPKDQKGTDKTVTEEAGAVAGYVDNVVSEGEALTLFGWAASPDLAEPASKVMAVVSGKTLAEAVPAIERTDVVEALGKPGLKDSGFELHLPTKALDCGSPAAGIKVIGELGERSGPIEFGEGMKKKLGEAC